MTKISVYNIDENVTADDKWIGTDVNTYNKTKNFTPRKLSHYFNNNQVINTGVDLLYKYLYNRATGTLSFETNIGSEINFSTISTFLLSKTTLKGNDVVEFFDFLVGTKVLLYKAKNINIFGYYSVVSIEEYIPDPNFFVVNVNFIEGNGFIEVEEDYMISLIDISGGGGDSPITIVNDSSLFSTGLIGTGDGSNANNSNFMGYQAGWQATNASYSNFFGRSAGENATNANNSNFFGKQAGEGAINAGESNFIGIEAGYGAENAYQSSFIGGGAGNNAASAHDSNFIGGGAGSNATNAFYSNFIGRGVGQNATNASYSNLLGLNVGSSFTDNNIGSNNIIIGTNISLPDATANSLNIGGILFGTGTNDELTNTPSIIPASSGKIGIGVVNPTNTLHIYSETEDTSGLRLERLTSASPTTAGQAIGVDASGNIVTVEGSVASNLQDVTNIGATTTNGISINTGDSGDNGLFALSNGVAVYGESDSVIGVYGDSDSGIGVNGSSPDGIGVQGISTNGMGMYGYSETGIGVQGYSETGIGGSFDTDSTTANIANFKKSGLILASFNNNGELTAQKLIKQGGTSSEILAADGSVITAGNNITITGGTISSVGGTGGGGSSVNYYLNGGTSQGTFGGTTYYEFSKTAVIGTGADFNINTNGYIASFITDVADPSLLLIPGGNWNLEFFFSASSNGGTPSFYVELYKYDGTTFTLITSNSATPEGITNGTSIDAYFTALAVPETVLTVNDRLAIRVFVNASSKTITLHTQNGHLCEVITTFTAGLTALNGLQAQVQNFATGTTGTDFAINSSGSTHTFNLPSASATARGVVTTGSQTFAGDKTFTGAIGASNLSNTNTGDNATNTQYSGLATSKQDTLQSTVNIKSINGNSILGSGDLTISGTGISSLNGLTGATQTFSVFTNFTGSPSFVSTGTNHQLKLPNAGPSTDYGLVTNGSQFIGGTKQFQSNPEIPVPAGNSGSCIVLGTTGGGGATGTLQIGSTTLYPTALEMQYVKGITSSVQTQLDNKANIFANITNDVYSGTIVWTGGAAPTVPNHTYSLSQVGNLVTLTINLSYGTAGATTLTSVSMELPSTAPTPVLPSSVTAAGDVLSYVNGFITTTKAQAVSNIAIAAFRLKSTAPNVFEINILRVQAQYRHAYATIQYFV